MHGLDLLKWGREVPSVADIATRVDYGETVAVSGMPADVYHEATDWLSHSMVDLYRRSPRAFFRRYVAKTDRTPPTKQMERGTVLHLLTLEPEEFEKTVRVIPARVLSKSGSRSGKAWTEWSEDRKAAGLILVTEREFADITTARNALALAFPRLFDYFAADLSRIYETSIFWKRDGIRLRCRVDVAAVTRALITPIDLKTGTPTVRAFRRSCRDFGYVYQDVHYTEGLTALGRQTGHQVAPYTFVLQQVEGNFDTALIGIDADDREEAARRRERTLLGLADRIERRAWGNVWEVARRDVRLYVSDWED